MAFQGPRNPPEFNDHYIDMAQGGISATWVYTSDGWKTSDGSPWTDQPANQNDYYMAHRDKNYQYRSGQWQLRFYPPNTSQEGDQYHQYIDDFNAWAYWRYNSKQLTWLISDISDPDIPDWENLAWRWPRAEAGDQYWSAGIQYLYTDSDTWINQNMSDPPDQPPIQYPISPEFPTDPDSGDVWTDPKTGDVWYYWDDRWQTKPEPGTGGGPQGPITTQDVELMADDATYDLDQPQDLSNQQDANWAMTNAILDLEQVVDQNTLKIADLTTGVLSGLIYDLVRASNYLRPAGIGHIYVGNGLTFVNDYTDVREVYINHTDKAQVSHNIDNLQPGDTLYMETDGLNFGRYIITQCDHTPGVSSRIVVSEPVSARGEINIGDEIICLAFPDVNVNDKATYTYVDARITELQLQIDSLTNQ